MRRILLGVAMVVAACGDNSNECDPGSTMNVDGRCVGTPTTCSDGTILVDGHCEIDPASCQDGTVLMGGHCVDPGHVTADAEEGAEPNGFGLIEVSANPAGTIALKPIGQHFVIHGKIIPFQDDDGDGQQDPDIDTYQVDVTAPTKISISADGLHGLAAGFVSVANVPQTDVLSTWTRFGVNLTVDTSKRELFLPAAGTYLIAIGDSRSLLLTGGAAGAAAGAPAFEYYVSIDAVSATPTALTLNASGTAIATGNRNPGEVKLFTAPMGEGFNDASLESQATQIQSSLVVSRTRVSTVTLKGLANGDDATPATLSFLGIKTGDTTTFVADSVIDYANAPTPFTLTINSKTAGALPTNGTTVSQPTSAGEFSTFYYDVAPDSQLLGMNLSFNVPVSGVVVDEDLFIFSLFTYDPDFGFFFGDTFQTYKGLLRHAKPGRYYVLTFDPATTPAANITATSSYAGQMLTTLLKGTPANNVAISAFESNAFTYAPGVAADPWQQFTGSGSGTGTITAAFYDQSITFGRLDAMPDNTCAQQGPFCDDTFPIFTQTYLAAGQTRGRILIPQAAITNMLVTVNTATVTGSPTFSLDFKAQTNVTDLGTAAIGTPATAMNKDLDTTSHTVARFIVKSAAGNGLTITATPNDANLNTRIQRVNVDESANGALVNNGGNGAADSAVTFQGTNGFTAFTVTQSTAIAAQFNMSVTASAPVTYMNATGTTAFSDACTGGAALPLNNGDEGVSAVVNAPAGFDFFGFASPQFKVFSNGFLSFDTSLVCASVGSNCFFNNLALPAAGNPDGIVAPYWDDLDQVTVCQKTVGTKLIIQWTGVLFQTTTIVKSQAILDGSNDKIEFVYGPTHAATGSSATIGLENQIGSAAKQLSFNTANQSPNTIFTPM
jgi:hypothetical protein